MNTNELDKIYIGSNEATKLYNGNALVWEKESPPIGRTITIDLVSSGMEIDGNNLPYEGGTTTLQDGDTVIINGGTLASGILEFTDFNLPNGQHATVRNNGTITLTEYRNIIWGGKNGEPVKNITFDFYQGNEYGIVTQRGSDYAVVILDAYDVGGWENVTIRGLHGQMNYGNSHSFIGYSYDGIPYNNGSGAFCSKNLKLEHIKVTIQANMTWPVINFWGSVNASDDVNYHEDLEISNVVIEGPGTYTVNRVMEVANSRRYKVNNITIDGIASEGLHNRLITLKGTGDFHSIKATNYYGNIVQSMPARRIGASGENVRFWNILGYNNPKYALVEMNGTGNDQIYLNPNMEVCNLTGEFCTAHTIGNVGTDWNAGVLDAFGSAGTLTVNNSVIQGANALTTSVGASGSNNYVHPTVDSTSPDISTSTFMPNSGSPIISLGGTTPDYAELDINGTARPSTGATLGAVQYQ